MIVKWVIDKIIEDFYALPVFLITELALLMIIIILPIDIILSPLEIIILLIQKVRNR